MKLPVLAFLAGAAVTVACLPAAAPAAAQDAASLVAKGRELLAKRDYPGARDAFLAAVAAAPKDPEARRGAAASLLGLGLPDEALAQANAGLDATGDRDAGLWLLAARSYLLRGDRLPATSTEEIANAYADARAKAAMALRQDAGLNGARAVLAKACRLTGETDRAEEVVAEGLGRDPRDFDLLFERGMLALAKRTFSTALESFARAAEVDPESAEAQFQKGFTLAFMGNWEECYAAFAKSAILDTANRRPLQYLARYAKDRSVQWYRAILKERPAHAWAHAYLAYYLAYGKDEAGATASMKAALALRPEDPELVAWSGQIPEALGRKPEALRAYRKAFDMDPATALAYDRLVDYATNPGSGAKTDERKALIEVLGAKRPENGVFWNNVGLLHRDVTKDFRESLKAYLRAAELSPSDQGIQNDTGLIYLYHGKAIGEDPRLGLPYFQRTLQLVEEEGQSPEMGYRDSLENLAVYYMEVEKDPERALSFAERRNDPEFIATLPRPIAQPSMRAAGVRTWAEQQLKR